ncbi:MAG: PTS sugar transporter subunit IIA [Desulfovibrio aminophilus]|jgi:PTS system nitrogen regulatory IIA component|uniref:PTS sugar transporter subunit IIA n=1 Tax=Desulfovibrio aminophilus TaxID=81425 RepID=UPI002A491DEB|nr:PTS sugar transporter subunit IIA [Desulfovibrionaceae bacterium]
MRLSEYLSQDLVLSDLKATAKADVLAELTASLAALTPPVDPDEAVAVLLERESLGTTGIGDGIAIPHGKLPGLTQIVVVAGRSIQGVEFDSLDFKPCHIFFLVLAPEQVAGLHLRILAHISRLLKDDSFRRSFISAPNSQALWDLLNDT